ncbi:MAG: hypothetical protein LBV78_16995 [Kitasatospora sp.]|jgi:hypothetical protein|nr:hypothetical protein [Kitasatospora sp.]
MKFARPRLSAALMPVALIAAALVVGLLGGGPSSAATGSRFGTAGQSAAGHLAAAGQSAAASPVVIDCLHRSQVRPGSFIFACADGNSGLTRMHWPTWRSSAYGTGMQFANDCVPNCAEGKLFYFPALVVLWRPQPLPQHPGTQYFTRVTRILTGRHCMPGLGGKRQCLPVTSTQDLSSSGGGA